MSWHTVGTQEDSQPDGSVLVTVKVPLFPKDEPVAACGQSVRLSKSVATASAARGETAIVNLAKMGEHQRTLLLQMRSFEQNNNRNASIDPLTDDRLLTRRLRRPAKPVWRTRDHLNVDKRVRAQGDYSEALKKLESRGLVVREDSFGSLLKTEDVFGPVRSRRTKRTRLSEAGRCAAAALSRYRIGGGAPKDEISVMKAALEASL